MSVHTIVVTPIQQNCRILLGKTAMVVDPGGDVDLILSKLEGKEISQIWLTHSHLDHCGGVAGLKEHFPNAKLYGHELEREYRERVEDIATFYGIPQGIMRNCPEPDFYLKGGETLDFEGTKFEVRFTPGHAPGHLIFVNHKDRYVFSGDTLFEGSIGRTDLPDGDYSTLIRSIKQQLLTLSDDFHVLSGHGSDTTIGREKKTNPFLQ
jgi:glyoxylase-like metal-dependent hydrolase (beta-lactamase superfamily II)